MDPNDNTQDVPAVSTPPPSMEVIKPLPASAPLSRFDGVMRMAFIVVIGLVAVLAFLVLELTLAQSGNGLLAFWLAVIALVGLTVWLLVTRGTEPTPSVGVRQQVEHQWVGDRAAKRVTSFFRPKDTVLLITRRHQIVWVAPAAAILSVALPVLGFLLWAASTPTVQQTAKRHRKRKQDLDPASLLPSHDVDWTIIMVVLALTIVLLFAVWVNWSTYYFAVSDGILLLGRIYPASLHWLPGKLNTVATRTVNSANIAQSIIEKVVNAARLETDTPSAGDRAFNLIPWMPRPKEILLIFLDAVDLSRRPRVA
ncbi:hypothetical protein KDA23_07215 [Candidatus Saccharibacteria bacterium]|nr:hypothetical protein [Candidatus Saccharibacteria bacterium]